MTAPLDIILLGFRNEVARERVLEALAAGGVGAEPHLPLERDAPLPHRLYAGISADRAAVMRQRLELLGAQVTARPEGAPSAEASPPSSGRSSATRPLLLLGAACLVLSAWLALPPHPGKALPPLAPVERLNPLGSNGAAGPAAALNQEAVELGDGGEYERAAAKLRQALDLEPMQATVRHNLQVTLNNWGVHELQSGNVEKARQLFAEALGFGKEPEVLTGLGIATLRAGDPGLARGYLEEAVQMGAADGGTLLALAEVYEGSNDRVRALEMLQRAREAGVPAGVLDDRIQRLSREVDAEWDFTEEKSRNFEIRFDAQENRAAARIVLRSLEAAYVSVGRKFDYYPRQPTSVVLYAEEDFHDITQTPRWAGAAYDGRIKLPVRGLSDDSDALDRIVRHEYAHSIIAALSRGRCPAWLNEGLAIWSEETWPGERRDWAMQQIAGQRLFTLAELADTFIHLSDRRAPVAYAQSYLITAAIIDRYDARKIPRLLAALGEGQSIDTAFATVYPVDLASVERSLDNELTR